MEFYESNIFAREVDYTRLSTPEVRPSKRYRTALIAHSKILGVVATVALTGAITVTPSRAAGGGTVVIVRQLNDADGSTIPTNPLGPQWRKKAERFRRLFKELPESDFERHFDIDHDL